MADSASRGLPERLSSPTLDGADPETLALLELWAQSDPKAFPALGRDLHRALDRWTSAPAPWQARRASPWDGLSGEAYATALSTWMWRLR